MAEEEVRITLRLPASLRDNLLVSAGENSRSMNGEIVSRLEHSFSESSSEADEWKRRYEDERNAYLRSDELNKQAYEALRIYRDLLRSTKGRMMHFVIMLKSLATMISQTGGAPNEDLLSVARSLESSARNEKIILEAELQVSDASTETKDFERIIEETKNLLNKIEG